jgi:hypothetical protein
MAILHGSWLLENEKSCLFIWGETWRKVGAIHTIESGINLPHPLAMTEAEFKTFLNSLQQSGKLNWQLPETAETPPEKSKKTRLAQNSKRRNYRPKLLNSKGNSGDRTSHPNLRIERKSDAAALSSST